jgi:SAM-dependent methyltransferase
MRPEHSETTRAQREMWSRGDFHRIGVAQVVVGELLVRDLHVHAGERVLDVAGGAGNTALAAARRFADATCTDYVPDLLDRARIRAEAEGLPLTVGTADAQQLQYADGSFDVVTSTFGAMFAPDQDATAGELVRVLRRGGRLGLANWTPDSFVGGQFALQAQYLPPPAGLRPSTRWGTREGLDELLGPLVSELTTTTLSADFVQHSCAGLYDLFRDWFGPVATVLAQLDDAAAEEFRAAWIELAEEHNIATDGTCEIPSPYLQVLATR